MKAALSVQCYINGAAYHSAHFVHGDTHEDIQENARITAIHWTRSLHNIFTIPMIVECVTIHIRFSDTEYYNEFLTEQPFF